MDLQWTSDAPVKSGFYGFRPLDHAPCIVEVDTTDDKIWEPTCMRALSSFKDPKFQSLWCGPLDKDKDGAFPAIPLPPGVAAPCEWEGCQTDAVKMIDGKYFCGAHPVIDVPEPAPLPAPARAPAQVEE